VEEKTSQIRRDEEDETEKKRRRRRDSEDEEDETKSGRPTPIQPAGASSIRTVLPAGSPNAQMRDPLGS
jgi:glutamyl/glutaminyl-tRNA synthetase